VPLRATVPNDGLDAEPAQIAVVPVSRAKRAMVGFLARLVAIALPPILLKRALLWHLSNLLWPQFLQPRLLFRLLLPQFHLLRLQFRRPLRQFLPPRHLLILPWHQFRPPRLLFHQLSLQFRLPRLPFHLLLPQFRPPQLLFRLPRLQYPMAMDAAPSITRTVYLGVVIPSTPVTPVVTKRLFGSPMVLKTILAASVG